MTRSLGEVLAHVLSGVPRADLARDTAALVERYRSPSPAIGDIVSDDLLAAAYVAYRMPATHAVCRRVFQELGEHGTPATVLDISGGSGAAAWPIQDVWTSASVAVVDRAPSQVRLGRRLAEIGGRRVDFVEASVSELPTTAADLVTMGYLLSELTP